LKRFLPRGWNAVDYVAEGVRFVFEEDLMIP